MKTPQRRFVVEVKSGRRQVKSKPGSIWGDVDIKAIVRNVENDAPHLFTTDQADGASKSAAPVVHETTVDMNHLDQPSPRGSEAFGAPVDGEKRHQQGAGLPTTETAPPTEESKSLPLPAKTSMGVTRKKRDRSPAQNVSAQPEETTGRNRSRPSADVSYSRFLEELAVLEAENERLKRLLVRQLRQENRKLETMLERFDKLPEEALAGA